MEKITILWKKEIVLTNISFKRPSQRAGVFCAFTVTDKNSLQIDTARFWVKLSAHLVMNCKFSILSIGKDSSYYWDVIRCVLAFCDILNVSIVLVSRLSADEHFKRILAFLSCQGGGAGETKYLCFYIKTINAHKMKWESRNIEACISSLTF